MHGEMSEKMTLDDFLKMPVIVFPYKCKEIDFILTQAQCICPKCGNPTEEIRGDIYESFGVLELKIVGVCHRCRMLIGNRSRVYPKRGVISQMNKGRWEDYPMRTMNQIWLNKTLYFLKPLGLGFLIGAVSVVMFGNPNFWFWVGWGFSALFIMIFFVWFSYRISRKNK